MNALPDFVVYLGQSALASACLRQLLEIGAPPSLVVTPSAAHQGEAAFTFIDAKRHPYLPVVVAASQPEARVAKALECPVRALPCPVVEASQVDAIMPVRGRFLVSLCYPYRIQSSVLAGFEGGGINVHSSLLPAYRGPAPVFWQIRDDQPWLGLTVHRMTDVLDSGPILRQRRFGFADTCSEQHINRYLGVQAAPMIALALCRPHDRVCKSSTTSSWQARPAEADYCLASHWPARRALRFLSATLWRNHFYTHPDVDGMMHVTAVHGIRARPHPSGSAPGAKRLSLAFQDAWIDVDAHHGDRVSFPRSTASDTRLQ